MMTGVQITGRCYGKCAQTYALQTDRQVAHALKYTNLHMDEHAPHGALGRLRRPFGVSKLIYCSVSCADALCFFKCHVLSLASFLWASRAYWRQTEGHTWRLWSRQHIHICTETVCFQFCCPYRSPPPLFFAFWFLNLDCCPDSPLAAFLITCPFYAPIRLSGCLSHNDFSHTVKPVQGSQQWFCLFCLFVSSLLNPEVCVCLSTKEHTSTELPFENGFLFHPKLCQNTKQWKICIIG